MYVVTFYSFKGGVGRSMALVNVGYQLAQAGRTVLLIDFDLEAPGLPTFNLQRPAKLPAGIVEYVHAYLDSGQAPSVADYVYKSESFPSGGNLWVMPAGRADEDYSTHFQEINWQELYEHHDGFLLFEELKEQWRTTIQPDYVLIDSRTGHTDIAGICTRQLPDAVCVLFFPNDQNLAGLKRVVEDIRAERRPGRANRSPEIALHFVVSNVPTLDDEEKIVATRLKSFSEQLKYRNLTAQIHHYDSLALINQLVFSKERPNSYLAKEYSALTDAVRRENLEDRDTALEALRRVIRGSRGPARLAASGLELSVARLNDIATTFAEDGEVSFWLALAWRASGDLGNALAMFDRAIDSGYVSREVYLERASLYRDLQNTSAAAEDFWRVLELSSVPVSVRETMFAVQALLDIRGTDVVRIAASWAVMHLAMDDCAQMALRVNDSEAGLLLTKLVIEHVLEKGPFDASRTETFGHVLGLALIGLGEFPEAKTKLNPYSKPASELDQSTAFNVAMADWGATGRIDRELFARVVELDSADARNKKTANYFQCLAIAHWATDAKDEAIQALAEARRLTKQLFARDFSAWRYLKVDSTEFTRDLDELQSLLSGENVTPRFMSRLDVERQSDAVH